MTRFTDLTGREFGRLTAIKRIKRKGRWTWECGCNCGAKTFVPVTDLTSGKTRSCGCLRKENTSNLFRSHGLSNTRFYRIWQDMRKRCSNKSSISYKNYGGRGITVCDRWGDFLNFKADMYEDYLRHAESYGEVNTTLERTDVDGNYEPSNCTWATYTEQSRNRRSKGTPGVRYEKTRRKWMADISTNGERIHLGSFSLESDAIEARKEAEEKYWRND